MPFVGQGMLIFLRLSARGQDAPSSALYTSQAQLQHRNAHGRHSFLQGRNSRLRARARRYIKHSDFDRKPVECRCLLALVVYSNRKLAP